MKLAKQTTPSVVFDEFGGLEIQPDVLSRPFNSWRRIENCDLFVPGSIRKVVGPQLFSGPFPRGIIEMFNYRRSAAEPVLMLGIGLDGNLYDLVTQANLASLGVVSQPWVGLFPGTTTAGLAIQYLISTIGGNGLPVKWEPVLGVTPIGVSPPVNGITVTTTVSATNSNAYLMQVGIQYLWTYFNPITLHESSPSPVPMTAIITPTVNTPAPATPYLTQVALAIPTVAPTQGSGYTRIRVYRTQDGGATFFLLPAAYNSSGVDLSDANLSVLIQGATTTVYDGVAASNIAPAPDQLMVNPPSGAPAPGANDPPPAAIWGAIYQNRLWLLAPDGVTLWFSNLGDFQSFDIDNFFSMSQYLFDYVTAIVPLSDRLVVFGKNNARQITGTDFSDFVEVPIDARRGCLGYRAAINDGDVVYALSSQALVRLAFAESGPPFVGDRIKPLTDTIQPGSWLSIVNMEIDTKRSQLLFAVKINGLFFNDQIIVIDLSRPSPFTVLKTFVNEIVTLRELEDANGNKEIYYSCADKNVYYLHSQGGPGQTLAAVLETQLLPLTDWNVAKVFKSLEMFGSDMTNWSVAISTDGVNFGPSRKFQPGGFRLPLGQGAKQIVLQFTHMVDNGAAALISRMKVNYEEKMSGS